MNKITFFNQNLIQKLFSGTVSMSFFIIKQDKVLYKYCERISLHSSYSLTASRKAVRFARLPSLMPTVQLCVQTNKYGRLTQEHCG